MPRKPRFFLPNIPVHIVQRGHSREPVFMEGGDYSVYLHWVGEAADRYDPKRADRFEAFAEFRIRGAMLDDLRARDTLSRDMRRLSNELRNATRKLESELGRTPDQAELASTLGLNMEELYSRQQKLSGSSVVGIDDAGPDLLERTSDNNSPDPFEITAHRETLARLVSGRLARYQINR